MRTHSLARRAVALVVVIELVCAVAFSVGVFLQERRTHLRAFDVMLRGRADSLLGAIQDAEDPDDNVAIDPAELRLPPEDVYAVYNRGGRLLGTSPNAPRELTTPASDGIRQVRIGHRYYRLLQTDGLRIIDRAETHGVGLRRPVTILYASPTHRMWHEVLETVRIYSLMSFGLLCVSAIVLALLLRRMMRPLRALAEAADGVRVDQDAFQAPASAFRLRELRPLATALTSTIERLRAALRLQQQFVSDAAHELKTAVAVERSTLQLLTLRERSAGEYQHGLAQALTDNERIELLVNRMLALARYEEVGAAAAEPLNLAATLHEVVQELAGLAATREVTVIVEAPETAPVRVTAQAAATLISNLLMNAIQHSPMGGAVRLRLRVESAVHVAVEDDGCGIAAESLPHLFERFYREDRSRSRQTGGAGLGLAICKSIVESVGGSIHIASTLGVGTTVNVALPRA